MKKIKEKRDSGITLVALVVTIVILLILAGVSLNLVLSNNGIVSKAKDAKNKTEQDQINTEKALNDLNDWMDKELGSTTGGDNPNLPEISETEPYVGYYADFTGDGTIDGIIYADLAVAKSGTWNNDSWSSYGYSAEEGLKNYYISQTVYPGPFGTKDVLTPTGTGKDRFYVMALEDFDTSTYYWYYNAYGKLDRPVATGYNDFGAGKANTLQMIDDYTNKTSTYGAQNDNDLWKIIQNNGRYDIVTSTNDSQKWFVSSKAEWAAFGDYLHTKEGITTSNYGNFGLSDCYWSSSHNGTNCAYFAYFNGRRRH